MLKNYHVTFPVQHKKKQTRGPRNQNALKNHVMHVFHWHWTWEIIPFKVSTSKLCNCVRSSKKKWPANDVFSGYRNHGSKCKIYQKALQVLHKILMKMKYPTNLKAWILHLQIFYQDSWTIKILSSLLLSFLTHKNCSLTANLVFFLKFKDAQKYTFHKKEVELQEWLAYGSHLNCDHSYLPEIFYLIERCSGIWYPCKR